MRSAITHWAKQVGIAFDQFINAIFGGWADETFSARCWRKRHCPGWCLIRWAVDCLLFFDKNHCQESYKSEIQRAQLPKDYRGAL